MRIFVKVLNNLTALLNGVAPHSLSLTPVEFVKTLMQRNVKLTCDAQFKSRKSFFMKYQNEIYTNYKENGAK